MQLGAFSISLAVKDLAASQAFYEKLGFAVVGGQADQSCLIRRNTDEVTTGLFQGMFERKMLTFKRGSDRVCGELDGFSDVHVIQQHLQAQGLLLDSRADPAATGPASLMLSDPDGNTILIDQHR
jgi:catechol 2,3-dioxygenase-like lactoylglutathione lyase family enzyme